MLNGGEKYLLALNRHPKIGAMKLKLLYRNIKSWAKIWRLTEGELKETGIDHDTVNNIIYCRKEYDPDREVDLVERYRLKITSYLSKDYPGRLTTIDDGPAVIYYRGNLESLNAPTVAVVGTRKMSPYGRSITESISTSLAESGVTIISGLALGIDSVAHTSAVRLGRPTVAVLGNGLDRIYPSTNTHLAQAIIERGGLLISEYAPGISPLKHHFPMRNRIVAGLSDLTIVVEGPITSGALITARIALGYNRDVGAVPGDINTSRSVGPNYLIQNGALVVTTADDILSWLDIKSSVKANVVSDLSQEEATIYQCIESGIVSVDKLVNVSKMSIAKTNSILSSLELKGLIRQSRGDTYIKL